MPRHEAFRVPGARLFQRPACVMVASGDADALNLRHIRRRRGHLFSRGRYALRGGGRARRDAPELKAPFVVE